MHDEDEPAGRLRAEIRARRLAAGLSQRGLADLVGYSRGYVCKVESGATFPPDRLVEAIDRALHAGGRLTELRERAWRHRQADRIGLPRPDEEEITTDRRQFVGGLAAAAIVAAEVSRRMAKADPDPLTLDELEDDVDGIAVGYATTPHAALVPIVTGHWRHVEDALDGRAGPATRPRLTLLAASYAFFAARLAFNTGDFASCRRFAVLASQHADQARTWPRQAEAATILAASTAALRSSMAYWSGNHQAALDLLQPALGDFDHPYLTARIAAYQSRTLAQLGQPAAARVALDRMEATAHDVRPRPGETPVAEAAVAMFRAGVATRLGDRVTADQWGTVAVAAYQDSAGDRSSEEYKHALVNLATARMLGPAPEPDAAATIALGIVDGLAVSPTHTVTERLGELGGMFTPAHRKVPAVREFAERYRSIRLALPAGSSA